ncbi:MAG: hypothetical protein H0U75_04030 [Legionella sp.]|nr:hypothetical protein [Legionella sp.]
MKYLIVGLIALPLLTSCEVTEERYEPRYEAPQPQVEIQGPQGGYSQRQNRRPAPPVRVTPPQQPRDQIIVEKPQVEIERNRHRRRHETRVNVTAAPSQNAPTQVQIQASAPQQVQIQPNVPKQVEVVKQIPVQVALVPTAPTSEPVKLAATAPIEITATESKPKTPMVVKKSMDLETETAPVDITK